MRCSTGWKPAESWPGQVRHGRELEHQRQNATASRRDHGNAGASAMSNIVASSTVSELAGHRGPEVRSDLQVRLEPRERGGLEIQISSRVDVYYGDLIRRQAEEVLEALGVRHAMLEIHDEGALPFVIA